MRTKVFLMILMFSAFTWCTHIRINGVKCRVVDPSFCKFDNCVVRPVSRSVKEINMVVRLYQLPVTNVSVQVEIVRRISAMQSLYKFEIDGCRFWEGKRRNPIAHAVYNFLRLATYSNINHSCPYETDLIIDHLKFDKDLNLRLPIGTGEYVLKLHWKTFNVLRCVTELYMQFLD